MQKKIKTLQHIYISIYIYLFTFLHYKNESWEADVLNYNKCDGPKQLI